MTEPLMQLWIVFVREGEKHYHSAEVARTEEQAIAAYRLAGVREVVGAFPCEFGEEMGWNRYLERPLYDVLGVQVVQAWHDKSGAPARPLLVAEVWQTQPVSAWRAWDAVVALCRGVG